MEVWGITDRGVVREQNQDTYGIKRLSDGRIAAVVCDGMGGARAGNVASTMAVESFLDTLEQPWPEEENDRGLLERSAAQANTLVFQRSIHDMDCTGMGTTLVAALAGEEQTSLLNEGDSRAYHITQHGITQLTRDHSLVQDLVQRGELTQDEARNHPRKNLITRALGAEPELNADYFLHPVKPGEFVLLCSDGLSNVVTDQEMLYEVIHGGSPDTCCQRLLDIALHRGAPDNVTVVLIQY